MIRPADAPFSQRTRRSLHARGAPFQSRTRRTSLLLALVLASTALPASAQLVTYTHRNGQNFAGCGAATGGPFQHSIFSTTTPTDDSLAVSDPGLAGQMSPSSASSHIVVAPASNGISFTQSGSVMRGPIIVFAPGATADSREEWRFTLAAPASFTFSATLSATNSAGPMAPSTYLFGAFGAGAQVIPDPGTPPGIFSGAIVTPGTLAVSATGTLTPGEYLVSLNGRAEGTNVWPHTATFDNSLTLDIACGLVTSYCTSGTTTNGCNAQMQGHGAPSATAPSGFTLDVVNMEGAAQGLIFYGVTGRAAVPWGASSSFVCIQPPLQRTSPQTAGGTPGACDGTMSIDWNAFVASHPNALGVPFSVGQLVQAQGWFRDPPSPKGTMLTDAIEFAVCP